MTTNLRRLTTLAVAALLLLTACSGVGDDSGDSEAGGDAGALSMATDDTAGNEESAVRAEADTDALAVGESAAGGGGDGGEGPGPIIDPAVADASRQIISTAEIHLEVDDLTAGSRRLDRLVAAADGFVFGEETDLRDGARTRIVIKVPPAGFRDLLRDLAELGDVATQTISTEDVTDQVVDLDSRIATSEASVFRLRALLAEATVIPDIANIENQLLARETELERLRGQRRTIEGQVSLATITAVLRAERTSPPPPPPEPEEPQTGFADGLRGGWDALRTFAVGASAVAGALLPWSPLLLAGGWVLWRTNRRRAALSR